MEPFPAYISQPNKSDNNFPLNGELFVKHVNIMSE